jgi:flagellar biosynthesis protein FlhA
VPGLLSLGEVQRVLQGLLAERVPVRDLGRIFEALTLKAKVTTDPEVLVEAARAGLGPALAAPYASDGVLRVVTIDPSLEHSLLESVRPADGGAQLLIDPARADHLLASLRRVVADGEAGGKQVVLVCAPALRPALRRTVVLSLPALPVLSYSEVTGAGLQIETVGVVNVHAIAA